MEIQQDLEWKAAQSMKIRVDLLSEAKQQLKFLAAVDRNRWLYEGPGLERAIYRYTVFWLPLLEKHSESPLLEGPLVAPLDCEWIWHCHRLNPIRYKSDCEEFCGRILDNKNVVSSVSETSKRATEEIWKTFYSVEPYELDFTTALYGNTFPKEGKEVEKCTNYDLVSAVERQSHFFYQVSGPHMSDDRYLQVSVARYKAFLHLIKRNKEKSIKSFSVPTYDIDLIWHTHQLHPLSYCMDLMQIMGKILDHDDTDSDRTKGQKLDVGFSRTTKTYEEMYSFRYFRAGAMYRGLAPSPVRTVPYTGIVRKQVAAFTENQKKLLPELEVFEVMLEVVGVKNLPEEHKGNLLLSISKTQPDALFNSKKILKVCPESGEKLVAAFRCQPTGNLHFELISSKSSEIIGTSLIYLEQFLSLDSSLTLDKWLELVSSSENMNHKSIGLRVAVSVTVPTKAPYVLHLICSQLFPQSSGFSPLPDSAKFAKSWTNVFDDAGNLAMSLYLRTSRKSKGKIQGMRKEVVGLIESGQKCILAEFSGSKWSMANSPWSLQLPNLDNNYGDDDPLLELTGPQTVRLYHGGRLEYESKCCMIHNSKHELESHLITAVQFSEEDPYGRAVALLDLNSSTVQVKEEWFLLPSLVLTFILGNMSRKERFINRLMGIKGRKQKQSPSELLKVDVLQKIDSGGCVGCGNMAKCGGCGGCGGGGCGGCGNMAKCGGCGGCGGGGCGGCGNMAKCGGCGGCGGGGCGGCGNMAKCGGCGGCGGGGCGGSGCGDNSGNVSGHQNQAVTPLA